MLQGMRKFNKGKGKYRSVELTLISEKFPRARTSSHGATICLATIPWLWGNLFPVELHGQGSIPQFSAVTPNPLATAASGSSLDVAGLQVGGLRQEKSKAKPTPPNLPGRRRGC